MNAPPRPPPPPRKPKAPVRKRGRDLTPQQIEGQARMKAAKTCATSFYVSIGAVVALFVGGAIAAAATGLLAIVLGFVGLARLGKVGMGPRNVDTLSAIERVSVQMARRTKGQARTGIGLGIAMVAVWLALFLLAGNAPRARARDRSQVFRTPVERLAAQELRAAAQREEVARLRLRDEIEQKTRTPRFSPKDALTEEEVARRLKAFLAEFPGTTASRAIRISEDEPYVTFRRILREHGWDGR